MPSNVVFPGAIVPKVTVAANGTRYVGISGWLIPGGECIPYRAAMSPHTEAADISIGELLMATSEEAAAGDYMSRMAPHQLPTTTVDPPATQLVASKASINYTHTLVLGVSMTNTAQGDVGLISPPGSLVAARCSQSNLTMVGRWVGAGATAGVGGYVSDADAATDAYAGRMLGQVVVLPSTMGSTTYAGVLVKLR